eukprot:3195599-Prymnesium_polylepis.3
MVLTACLLRSITHSKGFSPSTSSSHSLASVRSSTVGRLLEPLIMRTRLTRRPARKSGAFDDDHDRSSAAEDTTSMADTRFVFTPRHVPLVS